VTDPPEHNAPLFTVTVGVVLTVTVAVLRLVQPPLLPVTEYTVVEAGETVIELEDAPVFHEYVDAPDAIRLVEDPLQIVDEFTETVGVVLTVTVAVFTFVQEPLLPVTV
jgi:hypothetical protein